MAETVPPLNGSQHPPAVPTPTTVSRKSRKASREDEYAPHVWDAAHAEYRTGSTYGKISEIYGIPVEIIVRRKQRENWHRDLRDDTRAETFVRLAVGDARLVSGEVSDEDIIGAAATRAAHVVERHRDALAAHIEAMRTISLALKRIATAIQKGEMPAEADLAFLPKANVGALSYIGLQVGNALARTVPLERRAYSLDIESAEKPYEERMREWMAQRDKAADSARNGTHGT